uniref:Uncharacterized protein n=1 Tax=Timema monikensis TaxID=170555 RepID=A0A7R9DZW8_9NEOP|nr:unnamed protein product [Timema monikensis]
MTACCGLKCVAWLLLAFETSILMSQEIYNYKESQDYKRPRFKDGRHAGHIILYRSTGSSRQTDYDASFPEDTQTHHHDRHFNDNRPEPFSRSNDHHYKEPQEHHYKPPRTPYWPKFPPQDTFPQQHMKRVGLNFPPDDRFNQQRPFLKQPGYLPPTNEKDFNQGSKHVPYNGDDFRENYKPRLFAGHNRLDEKTVEAIVASGPDGVRHVIHSLPEGYVRFPEENYHHRFSVQTARPETHRHYYKGVPVYVSKNGGTSTEKEYDPRFIALYRIILERTHHDEDITDNDKLSTKSIKEFRPSTPYHRYSEPDPLYHPHGSALATYPTTKLDQPATTVFSPSRAPPPSTPETTTPVETSFRPERFPDSINAQLPPPKSDEDTRVPYVSATTVTQQTPISRPTTLDDSGSEISLRKQPHFSPNDENKQSPTLMTLRSIIPTEKNDFIPTVITDPSSVIQNSIGNDVSTTTSTVPLLLSSDINIKQDSETLTSPGTTEDPLTISNTQYSNTTPTSPVSTGKITQQVELADTLLNIDATRFTLTSSQTIDHQVSTKETHDQAFNSSYNTEEVAYDVILTSPLSIQSIKSSSEDAGIEATVQEIPPSSQSQNKEKDHDTDTGTAQVVLQNPTPEYPREKINDETDEKLPLDESGLPLRVNNMHGEQESQTTIIEQTSTDSNTESSQWVSFSNTSPTDTNIQNITSLKTIKLDERSLEIVESVTPTDATFFSTEALDATNSTEHKDEVDGQESKIDKTTETLITNEPMTTPLSHIMNLINYARTHTLLHPETTANTPKI